MKLINEQIQAIDRLIEQDAALKESLEAATDANSAADILEKAAKASGMAVDKTALVNWLKSLLFASENMSDNELNAVAAGVTARRLRY